MNFLSSGADYFFKFLDLKLDSQVQKNILLLSGLISHSMFDPIRSFLRPFFPNNTHSLLNKFKIVLLQSGFQESASQTPITSLEIHYRS